MSITKLNGVVCCGNIVLDILAWPVEKMEWNTGAFLETISEHIGGNGANTSYTLGRMGVPVSLISRAGDDERGDRLLQILADAGVDVSRIERSSEKPTPATVALVHRGGDRILLHRPGASRDLEHVSLPADTHSHFHFANPFALPKLRMHGGELMRSVKASGLTTSLDTGWDAMSRWMEDIGPCLPHTDLLFVNESEAQMLGSDQDLDRAAANLRAAGARDVVIKAGPRGCFVYTEHGREHVPGFRIRPVDTTGAGDCFAGGFLAGLYRGWSYKESARLANAVGGMVVETLGAAAGVRSFDETQAWMEGRSLIE